MSGQEWHDATDPPDADIVVLAWSRRGYQLATYDGDRWHRYDSPLVIVLDITHWADVLPQEPEE